ncbi:MAG: hypothetical protein IPL53_22665 [Ignavibacteria bacterium]|nr:hypothetical protein [Ignavibacteria bacterium]
MNTDINGIYFTSQYTGYAAANGRILSTTNEGSNWMIRHLDTSTIFGPVFS